jgi:hypothetical protein
VSFVSKKSRVLFVDTTFHQCCVPVWQHAFYTVFSLGYKLPIYKL